MSPEYLSDGLFIFHNPFAKHPLTKELFNKTNVLNIEFNQKDESLAFYGNNLPIVSRLNLFMGSLFLNHQFLRFLKAGMLIWFFQKQKLHQYTLLKEKIVKSVLLI